jgi:integrase
VGYLVANYSERDLNGKSKRRLDSYATEAEAVEAATKLARQMSQLDVIGAGMHREQCIEYASAVQILQPLGVSVASAASTVAEALKLVGDLSNVIAAVKFYKSRNRVVTAKRVGEAVAELLAIKKARGASPRYVEDLRSRLNRFAAVFQKEIGNVTTADIQAWMDDMKFSSQNLMGFRRVLHLLFEFAVARGYAVDNVAASLERVKIKHGATEIYNPEEIRKLLKAASPEFLPCLAIGAFAGLRSAEIERLEWSDVDLEGRHIVVGADKAKTATRRVVPIHDCLAAWLASYANKEGLIWRFGHEGFYDQQTITAKAAGIKWKQNALRHSYASYRFAKIGDAGRVAGELGNSAAVVHRHYRELVKPKDAIEWFGTMPEGDAVPVVVNRHEITNVARMPDVGTVTAN